MIFFKLQEKMKFRYYPAGKKFAFLQITFFVLITSFWGLNPLHAQQRTSLDSGWFFKNINEVKESGEHLTSKGILNRTTWMPAVVPGTILTSLLENGRVPDPFYGFNNDKIKDIYETGRDYYTFWFFNEFNISKLKRGEQVWLHFRGVNYACEIYLNGQKVNISTHYGMFLRQSYRITELVKSGKNKLAVLVLPPNPVGNPNGGQAGDGMIAKNVMHQFVAGWDWIQPVRDRNTGIWDKVELERTGPVNIKNPHIVSKVPGKRFPGKSQEACSVETSMELQNSSDESIEGILNLVVGEHKLSRPVKLLPFEEKKVSMPVLIIDNPKLWWPNAYGQQFLYDLSFNFKIGENVSDSEELKFGIRDIKTSWNPYTGSRQIYVNGQKVFIKGGNWIISDAMLRFSQERYDAEIRMHKDMNLNCIRIWGGAITERPEFYEACDKYGLLVMQDFWISGDGNGRWNDPRKKEDQWTRRQYPDDHYLFLESASDQIKMIRNHPSLAFWCGGNEMSPPEDIFSQLKDTLDLLDGTRWFVENSTSDSMSYNFIGGNGDGPYSIQPINRFFEHKTFPFNSEVGSVGLQDYEGLLRFLPEDAMVIPGKYEPESNEPKNRWSCIHPLWRYHKYIPYGDFINKYGKPEDVSDFAFKAQLVNYNQYRGLMEGFSSHMWEWYTGVIIWKTQNPWTAMRGQMYDYFLDQNAGLYGLNHGSEALHIFFDPVKEQVMIANNSFEAKNDLMIEVSCYDMAGKESLIYQELITVNPTTSKRFGAIGKKLAPLKAEKGVFLLMRLIDKDKNVLSENFYWLSDKTGKYSGLQQIKSVKIDASAEKLNNHKLKLQLKNPYLQNPVSFFNRISVVDKKTNRRVLPVFYSDNYVSIPPGKERIVWIDLSALSDPGELKIQISGWNTEPFDVEIE